MSPRPLTLRDLDELRVEVLTGVSEKKRGALAQMSIRSVLDLLSTYPRRWIDRSTQLSVAELVPEHEALVLVEVRTVNRRPTRTRKPMVTVNVGDGTGRIDLVFFNQPWRERQLRPGLQLAVFGRPSLFRGGLQMTNPVVDVTGDARAEGERRAAGGAVARTGRIVPIYPQSDKAALTTWELAGWVEQALRRSQDRSIADPVPRQILGRLGLVDRAEALRLIHLPETLADKDAARRRLAFDELLRVQLVLVARKRLAERDQLGVEHDVSGELVQRFHERLPYPLTRAQERAIAEITADLEQAHPMHRLLQGDVGSGKTVVAVSTLLTAVQGGHQAALMAPTEVLAEQHSTGVNALLDGLMVPDPQNLFGQRPLRVALLTNRVTGLERREVLDGLADGSVDIVIGTHALIQEGVEFASLGAVVVDEQHRFGVEQRAALRDKATGTIPDLLVMTATPIPRTAAMTVYGDLDVSTLDELPPGRTPIKTRAANTALLHVEVWNDVRTAVGEGRQAYVVCPLIEESDKLQVSSAEEVFGALGEGELAGLRLGLLHGRLSPAAKQATMEMFRSGQLDVIVATTVIEVGVDVPNATVMVILDADRFGIAQLHQLRGRVGRGEHASRCWLVTGWSTDASGDVMGAEPEPNPRVDALVSTTDGFALAEIDLELRGEGTLMSTSQKGRSDLRLASLRRDRELVEAARAAAEEIVGDDPDLTGYADLSDELDLIFSDREESFLSKS